MSVNVKLNVLFVNVRRNQMENNIEIFQTQTTYAVKYGGKNYTLIVTYDVNSDYTTTDLYDVDGGEVDAETSNSIEQIYNDM